MTFVLDASAALVWLLHEPEPATRRRVKELVASGGAIVPGLWFWDVAQAVVMAERRGRITAEARRRLALDVDRLPVVSTPLRGGVAALTELAALSGLTAYDACYLQLALTHGAGLCSTDSRLTGAARSRGVVCVLDE